MNQKTFTISLPDVAGVNEKRIRDALIQMLCEPTSDHENTKKLFVNRISVTEVEGYKMRDEILPPSDELPPLIVAAVAEYNRVYVALEKLEKETGIQSPEYGKLYEQKRAIESMFGTYRYMLDWNQKTKQFTVYLDR